MIDLDLIHQTTTEVVRWKEPFFYIIAKICADVLIVVLSLRMLFKKLESADRRRRRDEEEEGELWGFTSRFDSDRPGPTRYEAPLTGLTVLHVLNVSVGALIIYNITDSVVIAIIWQSVTQAVTMAVIALRIKKDPADKTLVYEATRMEGPLWVSLVTSVLLLAAVLVVDDSALIKKVPVEETKPSDEAITEAQRGYDHIVDGVLDSYDVEIASTSGCGVGNSADIPTKIRRAASDKELPLYEEHYSNISFIEATLEDDFTANPQLMLHTPSGVVTCYTVQYDPESDTSRLLVNGDDVDAEAPELLRRN